MATKEQLTLSEIQFLLGLIVSEQATGIIKHSGFFASKMYQDLEALRIKLLKMEEQEYDKIHN